MCLTVGQKYIHHVGFDLIEREPGCAYPRNQSFKLFQLIDPGNIPQYTRREIDMLYLRASSQVLKNGVSLV